MESSDESFLWTDASNDCNSDPDMPKEENFDNGSESGHSYKKKIQKRLFNTIEQHSFEERDTNKKSKKRKHNSFFETNDLVEPKGKLIKTEPDSDIDKHHKENIDEDFFNFKVKEEQSSNEKMALKPKTKKKKKHKEPDIYNESESIIIVNPPENDTIMTMSHFSNSHNETNVKEELVGMETGRTKKKKSKKDKEKVLIENNSLEEENIPEKIIHDDTLDITLLNKLCKTEEKREILHNSNILCDNSQSIVNNDDESNISEINLTQLNTTTEKKLKDALLQNEDEHDKILSCGGVSNKATPRMSKISDLITFEDEDTSEFNNDNQRYKTNDVQSSTKLQNYLKINGHLVTVLPTVDNDCVISQDDEVWVLKCPSEINITNLNGSNLVIDNKCKLKVDSQTYIGFKDSNINSMTVLTLEQNKPVIKNIAPSGIVHLHKRIPKPHFVEDSNMINNQTNFIPLPETKCRHPLFGVNYKKVIKVPKHITLRLNGMESESVFKGIKDATKKAKKVRKIERNSSDNEHNTKTEPEVRHKKKKIKRSRNSATPPKSTKRRKHDPESAETWESEKAIEQQLFNF